MQRNNWYYSTTIILWMLVLQMWQFSGGRGTYSECTEVLLDVQNEGLCIYIKLTVVALSSNLSANI